MSQAPSSQPSARKPSLPSFLGGRRLPGHTLVPNRSLRRLHRLLVLSLVGQVVTIALVVGAVRLPGLSTHLAPVSPAGPGAAGEHPGPAAEAPPYAVVGP